MEWTKTLVTRKEEPKEDYAARLSAEAHGLVRWLINNGDAAPGNDKETELYLPAGEKPTDARLKSLGYDLDNLLMLEFLADGGVNAYRSGEGK